jgi:hypothetical protein
MDNSIEEDGMTESVDRGTKRKAEKPRTTLTVSLCRPPDTLEETRDPAS